MSGRDRDGAARHARRGEFFGAVKDLPRPDLLVWLRRYIGRHRFPITPRLREARRWLAELEGEPSEESGEGGR